MPNKSLYKTITCNTSHIHTHKHRDTKLVTLAHKKDRLNYGTRLGKNKTSPRQGMYVYTSPKAVDQIYRKMN